MRSPAPAWPWRSWGCGTPWRRRPVPGPACLHTFDDIRARYASVQAYQVDQAAAGRRLQTARTVVAAALGLLLTGVLLTWLARPPPPSPRLPEGHPPRRHRLPHPNLRRRRHRSAGRRRRASACRDPAHRHHEPGRDPHLPRTGQSVHESAPEEKNMGLPATACAPRRGTCRNREDRSPRRVPARPGTKTLVQVTRAMPQTQDRTANSGVISHRDSS